MKIVSRQEIIALSKIAHIQVYEHEIDELAKQLGAVLSYAECLSEIAHKSGAEQSFLKQSNVEREDSIGESLPGPILAQAPATEAHYFVVPAIIKQN
jgi:aspartyl-tRNA(Asn)/glutamyl-tRNA(Gln) amidotransferase subunit C